jgi:hypothetical protein
MPVGGVINKINQPQVNWGWFIEMFRDESTWNLLHFVVFFVVEDHAFANNLHGLKFFEHDRLAALCADATGQVVKLFAVSERCTRRL